MSYRDGSIFDPITEQFEPSPHVLSLDSAAELLGIDRGTITGAVKRGENIGFPVVKAGRRYVVPKKPLFNLLGIEGN